MSGGLHGQRRRGPHAGSLRGQAARRRARTDIHTAVDTNGHYGDQLSDAELEVADLVMLDSRACDPERHRELTGMDNGPTLDFARRLAELRRPVWLRYVLVPG